MNRLLTPLSCLSCFVAFSAFAAAPTDSARAPLSAWVQYASDGQLSLRAIVREGEACPNIETPDGSYPTKVRATASPKGGDNKQLHTGDFPVVACEAEISGLQGRVNVGGRELRLPGDTVQRIVVVGDTGCRINISATGGDPLQDCANPTVWPWAQLAQTAADFNPDLVIHTGDYHYRERCADPQRCSNLDAARPPIGFGWEAWQADFFAPAAPLLAAAPWVLVRGNHENCDRGGEGWMRFLAPQGYAACPRQQYRSDTRSRLETNHTGEAYHVDLGEDAGLVVLDTGAHEDWRAAEDVPEDLEMLRRQIAALLQVDDSRRLWLLTHKPIWYELLKPDAPATALQAATRNALPENLEMVLSGHVHAFSTLNFARNADAEQYPSGRPAQVIVGGSGTQLEAQDPKSPYFEGQQPGSKERRKPAAFKHDGVTANTGIVLNRFSFMLFERASDGWRGRLLSPDGEAITDCRLAKGSKQMDCRFPD